MKFRRYLASPNGENWLNSAGKCQDISKYWRQKVCFQRQKPRSYSLYSNAVAFWLARRLTMQRELFLKSSEIIINIIIFIVSYAYEKIKASFFLKSGGEFCFLPLA